MEEKNKKDYFLPISILVAAILISGSVIYSVGKNSVSKTEEQNSFSVDLEKVDLKYFSYLGSDKAPIKIIEYSDYQCPFCNKFHRETFPYIKENYIDKGKVQFFYKDLAFLGLESKLAAEASRCAEEQNKFWEFHDKIFQIEYDEDLKDGIFNGSAENSGNLKRELFIDLAKEFNLDVDKFKNCLDNNLYKQKVEDQMKEAVMILGRNLSTPTFLVNDQIIQGAYPYSEFEKIIEKKLEEK